MTETYGQLAGDSLKTAVTPPPRDDLRIEAVSSKNHQLDLERLRSRLREKPRTKVGQVRQAWPYIKELFDTGHSLKDVWVWVNEIGIEIGYARLSHYLGQLRRAEHLASPTASAVELSAPHEQLPAPPDESPTSPVVSLEPLANLVKREGNRPGFHFNPEPDPKKLI